MTRFCNTRLERIAFGAEYTRQDATRAIETALLLFENQIFDGDEVHEMAAAVHAYREGLWTVAFILAIGVVRQQRYVAGRNSPHQAAAWNQIKGDFIAARQPFDRVMAIPVVNNRLEIVAWTLTPPEIASHEFRHREAEQVVGTSLISGQVELSEHRDAVLAGAPKNWRSPWRCYGLCSSDIAPLLMNGKIPEVMTRSQRPVPLVGPRLLIKARRRRTKLAPA